MELALVEVQAVPSVVEITTVIIFPSSRGVMLVASSVNQNTFPHRLNGEIYSNILQHELSVLLEDVSLRKRRQTYLYQHVGAPLNSSSVIRQYLNLHLPKPCIGRGVAKNWPQRLPQISEICHHMWAYIMTNVQYGRRRTLAIYHRFKRQK